MPNKMTGFGNQVEDGPSTVGEKLSNTAAQVKETVSDLVRTGADKIDEGRQAAAGGLKQAASALHEDAERLPGGAKVSQLAHAAAEQLSSTADYVREHDVDRMMSDVGTVVKNNPGRSLLAAAVIGFLVGRAFSSNA